MNKKNLKLATFQELVNGWREGVTEGPTNLVTDFCGLSNISK